ncbi:hypothetical protein K239x_17380 [Planctomycetes bacterium K23_9]|uniref:Uncharacterized protein n=1 Tax=Stieleria marina TaxID=1930275 RepID=A0A517NRM8_9BACT|nr:hypothetical protein K239x_17380 [Planctomycetes bacterium K23_9]
MLHRLVLLIIAIGLLVFVPVVADELQNRRQPTNPDPAKARSLNRDAGPSQEEGKAQEAGAQDARAQRDREEHRKLQAIIQRDEQARMSKHRIRNEGRERESRRDRDPGVGDFEKRDLADRGQPIRDVRNIDDLHPRVEHAGAAAEHLREAGMGEIARRVVEQAEVWQRQIEEFQVTEREAHHRAASGEMQELRKQIDQLRHEVRELREKFDSRN